jgi:hypothetical protein
MTTGIMDYTPLLREAIAEAKAAGFETAASDLEQSCFAVAFTTSSEMLGEHGLAIKRFLKATRHLATFNQGKTERLPDTDRAGVAWMAKTSGTPETASCVAERSGSVRTPSFGVGQAKYST